MHSESPARCSTYRNARYTTSTSRPAKGKISQAPLSANPREIARITTAREPRTRNLPPEERELLRRATNVKSATFSTAFPFICSSCRIPFLHGPLKGRKTQTRRFLARRIVAQARMPWQESGGRRVVPASRRTWLGISGDQQVQIDRGTSPRIIWRE